MLFRLFTWWREELNHKVEKGKPFVYLSLTLMLPSLHWASWSRGGCFDCYRGLDILISDRMTLYDDRVSIKILGLLNPGERQFSPPN